LFNISCGTDDAGLAAAGDAGDGATAGCTGRTTAITGAFSAAATIAVSAGGVWADPETDAMASSGVGAATASMWAFSGTGAAD
jgi:hypothetical protein